MPDNKPENDKPTLSRRRFLKRSAAFIAGTGLAGGVAGHVTGTAGDSEEVQTRLKFRREGLELEMTTAVAQQVDRERKNADIPFMDLLKEYQLRRATHMELDEAEQRKAAAIRDVDAWRARNNGGKLVDAGFEELLNTYEKIMQKEVDKAIQSETSEIEDKISGQGNPARRTVSGTAAGVTAGAALTGLTYALKVRRQRAVQEGEDEEKSPER